MQNKPDLHLRGTVTNRFEIEQSIKITGPGQMIKKLFEYFPKSESDDVLFVWLDGLDQAVGIEQVEIKKGLEGDICPLQGFNTGEKLIAICRGGSRARAANIAQTLELGEVNPLDVLLVAKGRWWSNFCKDSDCCPIDGRDLPTNEPINSGTLSKRHEIWFQWLSLVQSFTQLPDPSDPDLDEVTPSQESDLRNSLDDLAIRDCVLNHLAINRESQSIWIRICKQFLAGTQTHNNHVLYCLLAAVYFSNDDTDKADFYTKQSLLINPKYSLALLMQHGLEIKMDCKKVVAAFTHFSSDELLRNTPVRDGNKNDLVAEGFPSRDNKVVGEI
jgi:hypothetical protein